MVLKKNRKLFILVSIILFGLTFQSWFILSDGDYFNLTTALFILPLIFSFYILKYAVFGPLEMLILESEGLRYPTGDKGFYSISWKEIKNISIKVKEEGDQNISKSLKVVFFSKVPKPFYGYRDSMDKNIVYFRIEAQHKADQIWFKANELKNAAQDESH